MRLEQELEEAKVLGNMAKYAVISQLSVIIVERKTYLNSWRKWNPK